MTDEVMDQMNDVLSRLEGRLDSMEKGELPPALAAAIAKKKGKGDKDSDDTPEDTEAQDDKDEDKDDKEKSQFSDVITSEYLDWMEHTLKSAGVNTGQARQHFDDVAKANLGSTPESIGDGADYFAGQVKGRAQEGGNPSTNAISRTTGGGKGSSTKKSDFINSTSIGGHRIEEAYGVFKAAKQEEEFRNSLESNFEGRYTHERTEEITKAGAQNFDARAPLDEVMKALGSLNERIDNLSNGGGELLSKSLPTGKTNLEVPSTQDLGNMTWDEVHQLAGGLYRSE